MTSTEFYDGLMQQLTEMQEEIAAVSASAGAAETRLSLLCLLLVAVLLWSILFKRR